MYSNNLSVCSHCKKSIMPHRVCPYCGYYKGKPVIVVETVEEKKK
jgi:large subunit ribosomal protein L32